jgi:hypothetical protein
MLNIPANTRHVDVIFTSNPHGLERPKHSDAHNAYGKNDTPGVNQRLKISAVG